MNNSELLEKHKPLQYLYGDSSDQICCQSLELIHPQEFVQIDVQKLKDQTSVTSKYKGVLESHDIVVGITIV
jgi:hypothetical protein